jgi:micrococcal nuclease
MKIILLLITLLYVLSAGNITGKVVKVSDGDTITILTTDKTQVKIRLHGIDAPEKKQAFGASSQKSLADLCAGKQAQVISKGEDRYKRTLGVVTCQDTEANKKQILDGMAWAYTQYSKDYVKDEQKARSKKTGLWQDTDPVPPWEFRKRKK